MFIVRKETGEERWNRKSCRFLNLFIHAISFLFLFENVNSFLKYKFKRNKYRYFEWALRI